MGKALLFQGFVLLSVVVFTFAYFLIPPPRPEPTQVTVSCVNKPLKRIALTFDADMTPFMAQLLREKKVTSWYNRDLIDYLRANGIEATLFLTGMWAEIYPHQAYELAQNPLFEIGNHSYSHPSFETPCYGLRAVTPAQKTFELSHSRKVLKQITGIDTQYFRFPGGCQSKADADMVKASGMQVVGWDIISGDSFTDNVPLIVNSVVKRAHDGAIVVAHMHAGPNAPKTAEAMKQIIPLLQKKGFSFVKVSDVLPHQSLIACR